MCHLCSEYRGPRVGVKHHIEKLLPTDVMIQFGLVTGSLVSNTTYKVTSQNTAYKENRAYHFSPAVLLLIHYNNCPNSASKAQVEVEVSCPTGKQHLTLPNSKGHWLLWAVVVRVTGYFIFSFPLALPSKVSPAWNSSLNNTFHIIIVQRIFPLPFVQAEVMFGYTVTLKPILDE